MSVYPDGSNSNVAFAREFYKELGKVVESVPKDDLSPSLFVEFGGQLQEQARRVSVIIDDVKSTAIIGISLVFLLIGLYFRRLEAAVLVALSLCFGIAWTFGITRLVIGELNIMTVFLFVVLFGLGIDYGIHLLARYSEERRLGKDTEDALRVALPGNGGALTTTAATTALAFLALTVADFRGFSHFGFIAGTGVLMSLLAVLTTLPALILATEKHLGLSAVSRAARTSTSEKRSFPWARTLAFLGFGAALAGAILIPRLELEYDFTALRSRIPASLAVKKKLRDIFTESNSPAVVWPMTAHNCLSSKRR